MARATTSRLRIEVACAEPDHQELLALRVPPGTSVAAAIEASGIAARFPGADLRHRPVGIWGRPVAREQVLGDGDRVEIYRPLRADPREARRRLAAHGRAMGQHDEVAPDEER